MNKIKNLTGCLFILITITCQVSGQESPERPVSYRIFCPFIFNPAIAGSKDFSSIDLLLSNFGNSYSELASGNLRISKNRKEYYSSQSVPEFTSFGAGGYIFNDFIGLSHITGAGGTFSYHIQLDNKALSFLSFGVSARAVFNSYSGNPDLNKPADKTFFPQIDAGMYYYTPSFYAGISATNLLGNPGSPDSLGVYSVPVSSQIYLNIGYKFLLNRSRNILLEPSLIVNSDFAFSGKKIDMFKPGLKLYTGSFSIGTFFNDFDKVSIFMQYKYSKLYIGTYFEFAYSEPFFKNPLLAELAIGINLSAIKSGFQRRNHW